MSAPPPPTTMTTTADDLTAAEVEALRATTPGTAWVAHLNNAGCALPSAATLAAVVAHLEAEALGGGCERKKKTKKKKKKKKKKTDPNPNTTQLTDH
jgi:hypothetical protein